MPSIWKESPYYREFKGKALKNAERLGRVIRLAALRALMSGFTERYWRVWPLAKKRENEENTEPLGERAH